jgi:hypothetical protein
MLGRLLPGCPGMIATRTDGSLPVFAQLRVARRSGFEGFVALPPFLRGLGTSTRNSAYDGR